MKPVARRALAGVLAVAALGGVAWLSAAPLAVREGDTGAVRLSWRFRADAEETGCRPPTSEELAELPPHMRNPDACMGQVLSFALHVSVDGDALLADTLEPAGARGDRPVFVLEDLPLEPGRHRLDVRFEGVGAPGTAEAAAPRYALDRTVGMGAGEIVLITYEAETDRLVVAER